MARDHEQADGIRFRAIPMKPIRHLKYARLIRWVLGISAALAPCPMAAQAPSPESILFFEKEIRPIFVEV